MSYTLTVANNPSITIDNGNIDNTTSLTLVGKNRAGYGQLIQQNLINMMQSFAGVSAPTNAVVGQLYYDTTNNILKICVGNSLFKTIASSSSGVSFPVISVVQGDLFFKTDDQQLYVFNGASWLLVGPVYTSSQQKTAAIADTVIDSLNSSHTVLKIWVGNFLTAIISKDPSFNTGLSGFATIYPGFNVNSTIVGGIGGVLNGTVITNAQPYITSLGTLTDLTVATPIVGSVLYNANTVTYATQANITALGTLTGLTVSGTTNLQGTTNLGTFNAINARASVIGNVGATVTGTTASFNSVNAGTIGNSGATLVGSLSSGTQTGITAVGTLTGLTVSGTIQPSSNVSVDLGSTTSNWFRNVYANSFYGTSTTAQYADLAENYFVEEDVGPNDIVVIGGTKEVTASTKSHDPKVLGVMSPNPAYLMNGAIDGLGQAVALTGRVYVNVKGPIERGDCVVSSDIRGVGQKLDNAKYVPGCIVGKSLEDIKDTKIHLIEVVIGIR